MTLKPEERRALIEQYGHGFDLLKAALADVPSEARQFKSSPTEWSVHEVILHMADSESMAALRVRKLIVEPGSTLMAYEEARWADALEYARQSAEDALEVIRLARQTTYRLLQRLPETVFGHAVTHPEQSEPYTFDTWLQIYARHIPDHIEQLKKSTALWKASR